MDMAIGANSRCFSLGEITKIDKAIRNNIFCVCGARIHDCGFWREVARDFPDKPGIGPFEESGRFGLSLASGVYNRRFSRIRKVFEVVGLKCNSESWVERTSLLYESVFRHSGADILVDSSKNIKRAMILGNQLEGIDFRYLHLVRDVRGVAYSYQKPTFSVQLPDESEPSSYPATDVFPLEKTASLWLRENALISLLLRTRVAASRQRRISYEGLCKDPSGVLSEICNWLGIDYEQAMVTFGSVMHHNVGGNPSRFNSTEILNIRTGWKRHLSEAQQATCTRHAAYLMRLYGYDPLPSVDAV
jgi:hypothetical protein